MIPQTPIVSDGLKTSFQYFPPSPVGRSKNGFFDNAKRVRVQWIRQLLNSLRSDIYIDECHLHNSLLFLFHTKKRLFSYKQNSLDIFFIFDRTKSSKNTS